MSNWAIYFSVEGTWLTSIYSVHSSATLFLSLVQYKAFCIFLHLTHLRCSLLWLALGVAKAQQAFHSHRFFVVMCFNKIDRQPLPLALSDEYCAQHWVYIIICGCEIKIKETFSFWIWIWNSNVYFLVLLWNEIKRRKKIVTKRVRLSMTHFEVWNQMNWHR